MGDASVGDHEVIPLASISWLGWSRVSDGDLSKVDSAVLKCLRSIVSDCDRKI